jgi:pimeloyl-ACP methyl ester carboxylesterase
VRITEVPADREALVTYHSSALEGNPSGAAPERGLRVYLPPGYWSGDGRYPVVYMLHGYGGDPGHPIVDSRRCLLSSYPPVIRVLLGRMLRRIVTFETLDSLILSGRLPPFILIQPDGSLHLPHLSGGTHPSGDPKLKGSMYYDSPGTGQFGLAVFRDAVDFVDTNYRTRADRHHRAVIGGSMGGYGALLAGILHPDRFCAVAALSPSICGLDLLDVDLYVPFERWLRGKAGAVRAGREDVADILDTCDLVFSPDRPLMPTVVRDATRRAVEMDEVARSNWTLADAGTMTRSLERAFNDVAVRVSCEERDEFHFSGPDRRVSDALAARGIAHETHIFRDERAARISAHAVGIAFQVEDGLRFCLDRMMPDHMVVFGT